MLCELGIALEGPQPQDGIHLCALLQGTGSVHDDVRTRSPSQSQSSEEQQPSSTSSAEIEVAGEVCQAGGTKAFSEVDSNQPLAEHHVSDMAAGLSAGCLPLATNLLLLKLGDDFRAVDGDSDIEDHFLFSGKPVPCLDLVADFEERPNGSEVLGEFWIAFLEVCGFLQVCVYPGQKRTRKSLVGMEDFHVAGMCSCRLG